MDFEHYQQFQLVVLVAELLSDFVEAKLFGFQLLACLMYLNLVSIEPDLVSNLKFSWWFAISGHLFLALSECCFGVGLCFFKSIKAFINCGDIAVTTGRDGEVKLIAVYDFKW